ncbi:MAG: glycosyltransferase family 4 protein [Planctomycetota bacterium]
MRVLVHDYAGHAFCVQLSRALAARGHDVRHVFSQATLCPKGELERRETDPESLQLEGIALGRMIRKDSFLDRFRLERDHGRRLVGVIDRFGPEVVISANTPSLPQHRLAVHLRRAGIPLVSWIQDMYGVAARTILSKKLGIVGNLVGRYFESLDRQSARQSAEIVLITEDFETKFREFGISADRLHAIHNWAPIDSLPMRPRDNAWSEGQGLGATCRFLYSGTLAMKHNPNLLLELARRLQDTGAGELIVISEGPGVEWLRDKTSADGCAALQLLPYQPFERLAEVLASADVLVSVLEPDASAYCVPSKILSYMCAGRAQLAAMPASNQATRLIAQHEMGVTTSPTDANGFATAALDLAATPEVRQQMGTRARAYAEAHFDIEQICTQFCTVLQQARG